MFAEYIQAAMDQATYEIIDDPEPFMERSPSFWESGLRERLLRLVGTSS